MRMELKTVSIEKPADINFILGQSHFIKTIEDMHEAIVQTVPQMKFGICESSGPALVRWTGRRRAPGTGEKERARAELRSLLHRLHERRLSDQHPEHDQGRARGVHDLLRDRQGSHRPKAGANVGDSPAPRVSDSRRPQRSERSPLSLRLEGGIHLASELLPRPRESRKA
jgi:hypothetical protein